MTLFKNKYRIESIRLPGYDYSRPGAYFVTIVTHNRECLLGEIVDGEMILNNYGELARNEWLKTGMIRSNILIDEYIVMPNHIHGVLIIMDNKSLENVSRRDTLHSRDTLQRVSTKKPQRVSTKKPQRVSTKKPQRVSTALHYKIDQTEQFGKPVSNSIPTIVRLFKSTVTRQINIIRQTPGHPVWQRNYYEHVVREDNELNVIRQYIIDNPVNWIDDENYVNGKKYRS